MAEPQKGPCSITPPRTCVPFSYNAKKHALPTRSFRRVVFKTDVNFTWLCRNFRFNFAKVQHHIEYILYSEANTSAAVSQPETIVYLLRSYWIIRQRFAEAHVPKGYIFQCLCFYFECRKQMSSRLKRKTWIQHSTRKCDQLRGEHACARFALESNKNGCAYEKTFTMCSVSIWSRTSFTDKNSSKGKTRWRSKKWAILVVRSYSAIFAPGKGSGSAIQPRPQERTNQRRMHLIGR